MYLKGTTRLDITYKSTGKIDLTLYTNSNFAGSKVDYRSIAGYCIIRGGNLVTWRSKRQSVVSKSSTKAEFRVMSKVMWITNMLNDIRIPYIQPIIIHYDKKLNVSIAHDPVYHDRIKYVNIHRFYIQDHLEQGILKTDHVVSENQCADIFTKGLPIKKM